MDVSFVTSRLAIGTAIASPQDVEALTAHRITHVLNLRHDFDDQSLLGVATPTYFWNGSRDGLDSRPKPDKWFHESIAFTLAALAKPLSRVLIHCNGGISRSPSMVYAVLLALGLDCATAELLVRRARPQTDLFYKEDAERAVLSFLSGD